jgi:hypothetical protein
MTEMDAMKQTTAAQDVFRAIKGLSIAEAERDVSVLGGGWQIRVTAEDGEQHMCTCDYWANRINVGVKDGKIDSFEGLG